MLDTLKYMLFIKSGYIEGFQSENVFDWFYTFIASFIIPCVLIYSFDAFREKLQQSRDWNRIHAVCPSSWLVMYWSFSSQLIERPPERNALFFSFIGAKSRFKITFGWSLPQTSSRHHRPSRSLSIFAVCLTPKGREPELILHQRTKLMFAVTS